MDETDWIGCPASERAIWYEYAAVFVLEQCKQTEQKRAK